MKSALHLCMILLFSAGLVAQKPIDIQLKAAQKTDDTQCFDILLRSPSGSEIAVAGQNYRLFYNADQVEFLPGQITNHLDRQIYSKIDMINEISEDIGFVSLSIDGKELADSGVHLHRSGAWEETLNICFALKDADLYDVSWANPKRTANFATAEVAFSEWIAQDRQQVLSPNEVIDYTSIDTDAFGDVDISVYPNPTTDFVKVDFYNDYEGEVIIRDIIGRKVTQERVNGRQTIQASLEAWPAGAYSIVLLDKDGEHLGSRNIVKVSR